MPPLRKGCTYRGRAKSVMVPTLWKKYSSLGRGPILENIVYVYDILLVVAVFLFVLVCFVLLVLEMLSGVAPFALGLLVLSVVLRLLYASYVEVKEVETLKRERENFQTERKTNERDT